MKRDRAVLFFALLPTLAAVTAGFGQDEFAVALPDGVKRASSSESLAPADTFAGAGGFVPLKNGKAAPTGDAKETGGAET